MEENKGGRPKSFKSPEEFESKVNAYFEYCDSKREVISDDKGRVKILFKPYTITGLCVYLGITRETLNQYSKKEEYSDTYKNARMRIENFVEEESMTGNLNPAVSIFNLKNNFGWVDKQELTTPANQPFQISHSIDNLTFEQMIALLDKTRETEGKKEGTE